MTLKNKQITILVFLLRNGRVVNASVTWYCRTYWWMFWAIGGLFRFFRNVLRWTACSCDISDEIWEIGSLFRDCYISFWFVFEIWREASVDLAYPKQTSTLKKVDEMIRENRRWRIQIITKFLSIDKESIRQFLYIKGIVHVDWMSHSQTINHEHSKDPLQAGQRKRL